MTHHFNLSPKRSRIGISVLLATFGLGVCLTTGDAGAAEVEENVSTPETMCTSMRRTIELVHKMKLSGIPISRILQTMDMQEGLSGSPDARATHALIKLSVNMVYAGYSPAEIQRYCVHAATNGDVKGERM